MAKVYFESELYHHGVKGMKWGVRRYQNPDGTLTPAGKKRYAKMTDDELQKTLYKQVKKARASQSDWSNQWAVSNTIGKYSKAAQDKYKRDYDEYQNSDSAKRQKKAWQELDKLYEQGKIDADEYGDRHEAIRLSGYRPEFDRSVRYTSKGKEYSKAYLESYGRDLNLGYLRDLGYDEGTAKEFTERILKSNKKLLNGM